MMSAANSPNGKVLVVAHDAGAANAILSVISPNLNYICFAEGPAKAILAGAANLNFVDKPDLDNVTEVLLGTSIIDRTWLNIMNYCISTSMPHTVVLDHWSNYAERFQLDGVTYYPTELTTLNDHATLIASKIFPKANIEQVLDVRLQRLIGEINEKRRNTFQNEILFIGEYTDIYLEGGILYEQRIFEYFLNYLKENSVDKNLVLRPHPNETALKYSVFDSFPYSISNKSLIDDLSKAALVVGHDSYSIYVAYLAGIQCLRLKMNEFDVEYSLPIELDNLILGPHS